MFRRVYYLRHPSTPTPPLYSSSDLRWRNLPRRTCGCPTPWLSWCGLNPCSDPNLLIPCISCSLTASMKFSMTVHYLENCSCAPTSSLSRGTLPWRSRLPYAAFVWRRVVLGRERRELQSTGDNRSHAGACWVGGSTNSIPGVTTCETLLWVLITPQSSHVIPSSGLRSESVYNLHGLALWIMPYPRLAAYLIDQSCLSQPRRWTPSYTIAYTQDLATSLPTPALPSLYAVIWPHLCFSRSGVRVLIISLFPNFVQSHLQSTIFAFPVTKNPSRGDVHASIPMS